MKHIQMFITASALFAAVAMSAAIADTVRLSWESSSDPRVTTYRVYYGSSMLEITNILDVATNKVTISGVTTGMVFTVSGVLSNGIETAKADHRTYFGGGAFSPTRLKSITTSTATVGAIVVSP